MTLEEIKNFLLTEGYTEDEIEIKNGYIRIGYWKEMYYTTYQKLKQFLSYDDTDNLYSYFLKD